jgi:hypothetical protein
MSTPIAMKTEVLGSSAQLKQRPEPKVELRPKSLAAPDMPAAFRRLSKAAFQPL